MFSKYSFKGVIARLFDHFVTPVYKMVFEEDPPCMSTLIMEALIDIVDWYSSLSNTFSAHEPPHVLLKFSLDVLVMQEVAYHILTGLKARLHWKKKVPWPSLLLCIRLYKIQSFKHADFKAEKMNKYPFNL